MRLTPTQTLVLAGIMKRPTGTNGFLNVDTKLDAFAISSKLITAVERYGSASLSGLAKNCLDTCGPAVRESIRKLPPFITGMVSISQEKTVPEYIAFPTTDIVNGLLKHVEEYLTRGQPGFVQIMQVANNFCETSYTTLAVLEQLKDTDIANGDLGHIYSEMSDVITGGFTKQFGPLSSKEYRALAEEIQKFGTMYSVRDLTSSFTLPGLIQHLSLRGFSKVFVDTLTAAGLSITNLSSTNLTALQQAVNTIGLPILDQMLETCSMQPQGGRRIKQFTDLLDASFVFTKSSLAYIGSFENLATRITNVLGYTTTLKSWSEIGDLMLKLQNPDLDLLEGIATDTQRWRSALTLSSDNFVGRGSGPIGNPDMMDIMGSFIGYEYPDMINTMVDIQAKLLLTGDAINLKTTMQNALRDRLDASKDTLYANGIRASAVQFITPTNSVYREEINRANKQFDRLFTRFLQEKINLYNARISTLGFEGSINNGLSFLSALETITQDPYKIRYAEYVKQASSMNTHGEAVRASIAEGQNTSLLRSAGVNIDTSLDPNIYAQRLGNRILNPDTCCPDTTSQSN